MSTLERAIVIAAEGHAGINDKGGAPYILHPLRMMLNLSTSSLRKNLEIEVFLSLEGHCFWCVRSFEALFGGLNSPPAYAAISLGMRIRL